MSKFVPKKIWYYLGKIKQLLYKNQFEEKIVKNNLILHKNTFYIIRRQPPGAGLFSNINHTIQGLLYAENNGYFPVVDMQNYWTEYSQSKKFLGTRNAWEYFFKQTSPITLEYAYSSRNFVLSSGNRILQNHWLSQLNLGYINDKQKLIELNSLFSRFINLNDFCLNLIDKVKEDIGWEPHTTIGAFYRGGAYLKQRPKGHPVQPSPSYFIEAILKHRQDNPATKIFLSTDESMLRIKCAKLFGETSYRDIRDMNYLRQFFISDENLRNLPHNKIINTMGYLIEIYLLSECFTFIGGIANGSVVAHIINGGRYLNSNILNLGVY